MGDLSGTVSTLLRILGAGWSLIRADALIPRELAPMAPSAVRGVGRAVRLFAGGAARVGRPGERLARVLEAQGPVAIKLGQLLSTRGDVLGAQFAEDLARLKDRLPPFPQAQAEAEIAAGLGRPLTALFQSLEPAVAAASLAQVHPAVLADGRKVAVKVLRPGVERRVEADIAALRLVARLAHALVPVARRLEPKAFVETVVRALQLELDLRFEAAGADELREAMAADAYMQAPAVVWEAVSQRVLVLEWAPGMPLSDPRSLDQPDLDRKRIAGDLMRAFLAQALDHGVFHADLHEGNLFLDADGRMTAVDFGIIGRLDPAGRRFLAEILWGFLRRDYDRVAAVHFEAGYVPAHHDRAAFAQALRAVGQPIFGRTAGEVSMDRLLTLLFEITALFDMHLRPELVLLQKTMVTVEGVARRIDPDLDIWTASEPVVRRWITRELSPAARIRDFAGQAREAVAAIARLQAPPPAPVAPPQRADAAGAALAGFAGGALATVAAYIAARLMHGGL